MLETMLVSLRYSPESRINLLHLAFYGTLAEYAATTLKWRQFGLVLIFWTVGYRQRAFLQNRPNRSVLAVPGFARSGVSGSSREHQQGDVRDTLKLSKEFGGCWNQ